MRVNINSDDPNELGFLDNAFHPALMGAPPAGPSPVTKPLQTVQQLPAPPAIAPQQPSAAPAPLSTPTLSPETPNVKPAMPATAAPTGPRPLQDPAAAAHQANYNRLVSSPSGVAGIKHAGVRIPLQILDAIGQGFFPRFEAALPGTEGHHRALVQGAGQVVKQDTAQQAEQSRAELERAQAEKDLNPQAKEPTNAFEQWRRQNPDKPVSEWLKLESDSKPERQSGTVHEDSQGNMWVVSPDGTAKAVSANGAQVKGKTPEQKQGTVHQDDEGNMWIVHGDGSATPVTAQGKQLQGKTAAEKSPNEYADFRTGFMKKHPGASEDEIAAAYKRLQPAERPPQAPIVMVPGPNGMVPTQSHIGTPLPTGTVTPGGMSSENVSEHKTEEGEKKARGDAQKAYSLAQKLAADNTGSSDAALLMQFIGAIKPEAMGKIRFNKGEQDFIMGSRGLMDKAESVLTGIVDKGQRLTPADRQRYLRTMGIIAGVDSGNEGGKIRARDPQGKLHEAPAGTPLPQGWKQQ